MSLFNEAEWTSDEADGQIPEPDMAKVAPPKKTKTKGGKLRMVSGLPKETIDFKLSKEEQICPECGEKLTEVRKTIAVADACKAADCILNKKKCTVLSLS